MNPFFFLFRELLGAVRAKSGALLVGMIALILVFLGVFSCFFLLGRPAGTPIRRDAPPWDITAYISPKLSTQAVDDLYRRLRDRPDVAAINYVLAGELVPGRPGGAFRVRVTDPTKATALARELEKINGVTEVITAKRNLSGRLVLPGSVRIGLLIGLVVSGFASLFLARMAFGELLHGFYPEIKLMRLAGTPERTMQGPVVALGIVCGLLAGLVLIVVIYILHLSALSSSGAILSTAAGLRDPGRVLTASLLSLFLGLFLGSLSGLLGASLLSSPRFQD